MQIGFSKKISETLLDEFFSIILEHLKKNKKLKFQSLEHLKLNLKKKEKVETQNKKTAVIKARKTISFKASKELKSYINKDE